MDRTQTHPSAGPASSASLLPQLIGDDDLACAFLAQCAASTAARVGLTCRAASQRLQDRTTARVCHEAWESDTSLPGWATERLCPIGVGGWTFERLHLSSSPPEFECIQFGFASDTLSANAERQVERAASWLACHPGLTVRVDGYARQEAPSVLGVPLAQARAVRVRQRLLEILQSHDRGEHWSYEGASDGVRPGGYSEAFDFDEVLVFYEARAVGTKVQAQGRWPHAFCEWSSGARKRRVESTSIDDEVPCSIAEITISGFEPTSRLAF